MICYRRNQWRTRWEKSLFNDSRNLPAISRVSLRELRKRPMGREVSLLRLAPSCHGKVWWRPPYIAVALLLPEDWWWDWMLYQCLKHKKEVKNFFLYVREVRQRPADRNVVRMVPHMNKRTFNEISGVTRRTLIPSGTVRKFLPLRKSGQTLIIRSHHAFVI